MSDFEKFIKNRLLAELTDVMEKIEESNYDGFVDEPEDINKIAEYFKNWITNFEC